MDWEEASNLQQRAWALIEIKRYQEAVPLLTRALEYDPEDSPLLCGLSTAYYGIKDWKTSLRFADQAVQCDPSEEWAHRRRSLALEALGQNGEALLAAQEAICLKPESNECLLRLASIQTTLHLFTEAEETARKALEAEPENISSYLLL